jgi:thioesterase domain-containing protein
VLGLQSPTIAEDGPLPESIDELAERYVSEIRRIQPHGPYHLLGWSLGGAIAHAMAVRLQAEGESVPSLVMLDSFAERAGSTEGSATTAEDLLAGLGVDPAGLGGGLPLAGLESLDGISEETLALVLPHIGGPLSVLTPDRVMRMITAGQHTVELMDRHRPGTYDGDVLYFTAALDDSTGTLGADTWRPFVSGVFDNHQVETTHWHMTVPAALDQIGPLTRAHLTARAACRQNAVAAATH